MKRIIEVVFTKGLKLTIFTHLGMILCSLLFIYGVMELLGVHWYWALNVLMAVLLGTIILVATIISEFKSK